MVGRTSEVARLNEALRRAATGEGAFWVVSGPVGIGKSRLIWEVAAEAKKQGFEVLSGECSRSPRTSCEVLERAFRSREVSEGERPVRGQGHSPMLLVEEPRGNQVWEIFRDLASARKSLVISRETPSALKERWKSAGKNVSVLHLSRKEGRDAVSPTSLDALGERVDGFLHSNTNAAVLISDVDYLIVQNTFLSVLRLLQFLRESADSAGGQILLSFNPKGLDPRESALIEGEGEVLDRKMSDGSPSSLATTPHSSQTRNLAYLERLEQLCRAKPILLLLEDLGWADPETPAAISFIVRNSRHLPILILGAIRTSEWGGEVSGNAGLNDVLDDLARQGLLSRLTLRPHSPEEIRTIAENHLTALETAPGPASSILSEVPLEPSSGNPLVALEILRMLLRKRLLRVEEGQWRVVAKKSARASGSSGERILLHQGLRHLVLGILEDLDSNGRELLETAAVLGSIFPLEPLAAILDSPLDEVRTQVQNIGVTHQFFQEFSPGSDLWSFAHPYFHEVIFDNIPPERAASIAGDLAEWFRWNRPQELSEIGHLFLQARDGGRGIPWMLRAAERAVSQADAFSALLLARGIVDLMGSRYPSREKVFDSLLVLAEAMTAMREHRYAESLLTHLLQSRPPATIAWRTRRALIDALLSQRRLSEAKDVLSHLANELVRENDPEAKKVLLTCEVLRAELEMLIGDAETSAMTTAAALKQLEEADTDLELWLARALEHQGWNLLGKGNLAKADLAFARGRELAHKHHSSIYSLYHSSGLGRVETLKGNGSEALRAYAEAEESARSMGDLLGAAEHQRLGAEVLYLSGRLGEAEEDAMQALQVFEKFDSLDAAGKCLYVLGRINIDRRRWEDARVNLSLAINRFSLSGETGGLDEARLYLALVLGEMGNPKGALDDIGPLPTSGAHRHLVLSRLRELLGESDEAMAEAKSLQESAETLGLLERQKVQDFLRGLSERAHSNS